MMENISTNYTDYFSDTNHSSYDDIISVMNLVENIIIITGLPLALLAIVAVFILARKDHGAPVFIINLLISDVIQLCSLAAWMMEENNIIIYYSYTFGLMASVGFMVCISLERYLVITKPLWYRFRRDIRITVTVCVIIWTLPLVYVLPVHFNVDFQLCETVYAVFLLLPLPLFIFFLVGTLKALSAARSVPDDEKRRIVASLVAVLLIYILLIFPSAIWGLVEETRNNFIFHCVAVISISISPLADLILYFFTRKGVIDTLLKLLCCKMSNRQETGSTDNDIISGSRTEAV